MNLVSLQVAVTGSAQNLPSNPIRTSITVTAKSTNTGPVSLSANPAVTLANGYLLEKGQSIVIPMPNGNTGQLWAIGTAADVFSVIGS